MPFFDDAGIVRENHRGPVIGALAVFGEQVERMVGVSLAWAVTLAPAAAAFALPGLPAGVRAVMFVVSSLAVVPATGALYRLAATALDGDEVGVRAAIDAVRSSWLTSLRVLGPLYGAVTALVLTAIFATGLHPVAAVVAQVATLLALTASMFWGPLLARVPDASTVGVLRGSLLLAWRSPALAAGVGLVTLVFVAIGVLTIAGMALAVPAVLGLLHTNLVDHAGGMDG
ncbi:hypothetical protein E1262_01870 [Jiangella aurantiaca]|uniref:DUF624 domain-containing protein n=1 Tax=Jiangella aurantiaca TaxID=2530373 RepID=A0A4R5AJ91_9ACTN|nr:hypothetical protein [Jiangella aurantiaca]TDD72631.1 hypothetical protein E1262_01870 [Jiangella aurantiaca]